MSPTDPAVDCAAATRTAAGAEIALAMGLTAEARRRAARALRIDPACRRAHAVLLGLAEGRGAIAPASTPPPSKVAGRVVTRFAAVVGGDLNAAEARVIVEAYIGRGHRRTRMPRRLGGGVLPGGVTVLRDHRRPDLGFLLWHGRIVDMVERKRAR